MNSFDDTTRLPSLNQQPQDKSVKCWDLRAKSIGDCARLLDAMPHAALSLAWLNGEKQQGEEGGAQCLAVGECVVPGCGVCGGVGV